MKFAYLGFPEIGGSFSVYRNLRAALRGAGIDVYWVGAGDAAHRAAVDPAWVHERRLGIVCGHVGDSEQEQTEALVHAIERRRFVGVFVAAPPGRAEANAVRYLPKHIRRVMIVHNMTPAAYNAARAIRNDVDATVGVSPRIRADLVNRFGFDEHRTFVVQSAAQFAERTPRVERDRTGSPRLLTLGPIDDQAKGILSLPTILRELPAHITLTVAGDGPDFPRLVQRCTGLGRRVRFIGIVPPHKVPDLFADHDILVAPSHFEGCMIRFIGAMMSGCVPVASVIHGATDWIVDHGKTGLLFPVGDTRAAARCIRQLVDDPAQRSAMSDAAQLAARNRFTAEAMAAGYRAVVDEVMTHTPVPTEPLPFRRGPQPGTFRWTSGYTYPVTNLLRLMRERDTL